MTRGVNVFDDFLNSPGAYMRNLCGLLRDPAAFRTFEFPEATFHGIHLVALDSLVPAHIAAVTGGTPSLSFLRRSPLHQVEPHFIHSDVDMGEWSAILYLNAEPPEEDGTAFWTHNPTGTIESSVPHERSIEGKTAMGWSLRKVVHAKFNRLLIFPSSYFHSRAIFENWGNSENARLTQITFGTGDIFA